MIRWKLPALLVFLTFFFLLSSCTDKPDLVVDDLRCNNRQNPLGVEEPRLSWKIRTNEQGIMQEAWEIEMATSESLLLEGEADVWKSGKQDSDEQFNITPDIPVILDATQYYWRMRIWDNTERVSRWSEPARFTTGLLEEDSWKAEWITYPDSMSKALPCFREVFNTGPGNAPLVRGLVFLSGLGSSELYINGEKVDSTRFLDPAQTNYEQYAFYSSFDVTHLLKAGKNAIGVMLGNGWFAQDTGWNGAPFDYGKPMFRLQLVVEYSDGTRRMLVSDEEWKWKDGPVQETNVYLGETYDARKELEGWAEPGTEFSGWENAILAKDNIPPRLTVQPINPIRKIKVIEAKDMWKDPSGNWVYDFGVNIAGIPQIQTEQPRGTRLTIRMAEEVNEEGSLDFRSLGWKHHGQIFAHEYVCKGVGPEQWSPRFSYHGFRYAELSGFESKPDLSTIKLVVVHSDVEKSGSFECANPQINKLHEMALRTLVSNLHGIPTDCPNREKCGWLGDTHAYVKMANLNFQMDNFWRKYLEDIRSGARPAVENTLFHERYNNTFYHTDKPSGLPYMIAPGKRLCGVSSPDWGTALVQIPWWLYVYYGNEEVLADFYPDMKVWTDYVATLASDPARTNKYDAETEHIIYQGLGDWCPPRYANDNDTPVEFTSTAFHYLDVSIMQQVAGILGKSEDARKYAKKKTQIADEMVAHLYDARKNTYGSQTADVMALDFGLVPQGEEKAVADAVVRHMNEVSDGFMNCGIFGITRIGSMLARHGNPRAAWEMFTKKGENSFAWMWNAAGATTLWETLPVNKISQQAAAAASHSHPMQAGYDVFFFEDIAGIRPDPSGYGFKVIRFEPLLKDFLPWAKASIESSYGTVVSDWKMEEGTFNWSIEIPPNASGRVALPKNKNITVNGETLNLQAFEVVSERPGVNVHRFPSGHFNIQVTGSNDNSE